MACGLPGANGGPQATTGDGDAFVGIAVALCAEGWLALLVVLSLCGVAVSARAVFLLLAPTLILTRMCLRQGSRQPPLDPGDGPA